MNVILNFFFCQIVLIAVPMAMVAILHVTAHQTAKILLAFAYKIIYLFSQIVHTAVPMAMVAAPHVKAHQIAEINQMNGQ